MASRRGNSHFMFHINVTCVFLLAFAVLCYSHTKSSKISYSEKLKELWQNRRNESTDFYEFLQTDILPRHATLKMETNITMPDIFMQKQSGVEKSTFPCKVFHNHTNPKSVHRLKPSDIDIIAAMGDSITAAFGAKSKNLLEIFIEFRGVSWSAGGDDSLEDVTTLPNIIKKYNENVKGYSVKPTPPKIRIPWRGHLNFAVSGAIATDLPGQAKRLIADLKTYDNYADSWKLLTIWIGGNDLCACCKNDKHTPEKYIGGIKDALDMLHKEVPKMFVNLVQILDVTRLNVIKSCYCKPLHFILCYCGTSAGEETKTNVSRTTLEYQKGVNELINSGRYDTRDDFTVVIQPFFEQTTIPRNPDGSVDMSYIAPDCFHFSEKGHRAAALALWNSMIEPVGKKRLMWSKGEQFECPSDSFPYFYTNKNSNPANREKVQLPGQELAQEKNVKADNNPGQKMISTNTVTVAILSSCGILILVVVAALVIKRKSRQYKKINVTESSLPSYSSL